MPRLSVGVGGWNARPEHFAVALVVVVFVIRWVFGEKPRVALTSADCCVIAYILWNYISSFLMSPDPKLTLRWALLNNLVILPFFLLRFLVPDESTLRWVFRVFVGVGIGECVYGIVCFVSRQLFETSVGVEVGQYAAGFGGVYGTQYEPNLLGSYAACTAFALLVIYFMEQRKSPWALGGAIVAFCAMVVSLSRAALLSFGIVFILLTFLGVRRGLVQPKKVLLLAVCLALFGLPILPIAGQHLTERFTSWTGGGLESDVETIVRLTAWTVAVQDIWQHPLVGNGTASFQLLADAKEMPILGDRPWVGNSVLRIVHDTGVVGLALFGLMVIAIGQQVRKSIASRGTGQEIIFALSASCLVYAIAFMSTEGTILAFFWVHAGLLSTAATLPNSDGQRVVS
jgi:O-antigen ligase